jgi:hypothetical protein
MKIKIIAKIGLLVCVAYFVTVTVQIIFNNNFTLYLFSIITMLSGMYMTLFVISFPLEKEYKQFYRIMAILCVSSCMILTNVTHFINIAVIKPLIASGIFIPDYFQTGKYPSVLMGIDYLGWGLFMGLAFIFSSCFINTVMKLRKFLLLCGCLCLVGFIGVVFNENLWYIAPVGYGIGTAVICVKLLLSTK